MILPAPFGYEYECVTVTTVAGKQRRTVARRIPIRRPHEPVFLEWQGDVEGLTPDTCLVCGHDRYDEMHNPMLYTNKEYQ